MTRTSSDSDALNVRPGTSARERPPGKFAGTALDPGQGGGRRLESRPRRCGAVSGRRIGLDGVTVRQDDHRRLNRTFGVTTFEPG